MTDFTMLEHDNTRMTCRMPADETVVEVLLKNGETCRAWYGCNIMDAGDWDFVPLAAGEDEPGDAESIADEVVGWRPST